MIYKFRIISDENTAFARELLIDSSQTFLDFHHCLQENLAYDPAQLASFFITNTAWEKERQITLIDMMDDTSDNCTTMDQCEIGEHFSEKGQRMLYVFDFFSERSFFIELTEVMDVSDSKALPKVIFSHGDPPPQINLGLDDFMLSEEDLNEDFDEDMTGDGFDDDIDFMDTDEFPNE
jgi:hypothetical protein